MVPECCASGQIRLYRASAFPHRWEFVGALRDDAGAEPSPFEHDGRWWMFAETAPGWRYDCLRLFHADTLFRSEEHTSELQSLMRISYAVFCLKKKKRTNR